MATDETARPVGVICPRCGGSEARPVAEARGGKGAFRKELGTRLQKSPEKSGDGCLHFIEGMVLTGMGAALAYTGVDQEKPLYLAGGVVLALICFFGTIAVVRGDRREKDAEEDGLAKADWLWEPAHYCYGCEGVFCPGGTPWLGVLDTDQFKKMVWTEAGYGDQLTDKSKNAEVPPGTLPWY
ncbi:hypothetical protein [Streptomyces sp. NPDC048172]|uniref:hypothetical protein n=1 Tax=Streptomyces sp. NPDC048172 TaxID=3365505 RepID=UPI0037183C20